MPYKTDWIIKDRVLCQRVSGQITSEEIRNITREFMEYVKDTTLPLYSIIDLTTLTSYPVNLDNLRHSIKRPPVDNLAVTIIVTSNSVARFLAAVVMRFLSTDLRIYATMEDALEFLRQYDKSLKFPENNYETDLQNTP